MVAATFRHDTSRNLDPQLHTHAVIANMVQGADGKWRTMANEKLYESKMLIGAIYRSELARGLGRLGYEVEKTHADGRFEIAGVSREVIEAFSTRRAEIEAGMAERGMGAPGENPRLAERAALMSRGREARRRPRRARPPLAAPGRRFGVRRRGARGRGQGGGAGGGRAGGGAGHARRGPGARCGRRGRAGARPRRTARNRPLPAPAGTRMRHHSVARSPGGRMGGRAPRPSARRCSRAPRCSPLRSPGTPAR